MQSDTLSYLQGATVNMREIFRLPGEVGCLQQGGNRLGGWIGVAVPSSETVLELLHP